MRKSTSLWTGIGLMVVAFLLFSTDSIIGAIIGTGCLLFALIFINYSDSCQLTQDDKRSIFNHNKSH